jgi:signal transduction histidine kinase
MRSLRQKLLLSILPLCLIPLIGISAFSYFVAKERITEDRTVLYLEQLAREVADAIRLTIVEKQEEVFSMTLFGEFLDYLSKRTTSPPDDLLDRLMIVHEVYDVIALFDADGRLVAINTLDRKTKRLGEAVYLDPDEVKELRGQSLLRWTPPESTWLQKVRAGLFGYIDWHRSELVNRLYHYDDNDVAQQFSVGFAAPVFDDRLVVVGGVLALMNWEFIQEILDKVEDDLEAQSLSSGYAFLFGGDSNTIIAHKERLNRQYPRDEEAPERNNYGTTLVETHGLVGLREAVVTGARFFSYEYPTGTPKISGLAPVNHDFFRWSCGVGIDDEDIFAPVQELRTILITAASVSILLVVLLTFSVAKRITIPLKELTQGSRVIAKGELNKRVDVSGKDEIGELAQSFNDMAQSLEERSQALIELNRQLEVKVQERTKELRESNEEVHAAYRELKDTQVQLVQSEKMASLGQLVAGIAHEIKNPLNFIYGNTEFLTTYVHRLQELVAFLEKRDSLNQEDRLAVEKFKADINYSFMLEDLETLIANLEEGAKRIHSIIGDLRTFSRMESDDFRKVDIHEQIDLALNLLQNEYRGRIEISREYSELPPVECHPGKMNQVFMNLLLNACQAIPDQGHIIVRTESMNGTVEISVEDDGEGIPEKVLDRVFEPFFTTKPVGTGTGLGLSISYAIIQQHKGSLRAESKAGRGTRFTIEIPVEQWKEDTRS